ncbi:MAG TPA: TIGR01458 family HAD-type hydrolase [Solirubrobacterales bacterium]|nr:TIGR01458 family HAD-type hydrolase [Solirubrobacterales bacterium]HNF84587.1 TIGR01458 family HAD-type hydrolase [Solirubrobacterales bacterium]
MPGLPEKPDAILLDVEGVLYIQGEAIDGATETLNQLRELAGGIRLVTNTSSISRKEVIERVRNAGFDVADEEVLTPAAMAVRYCREMGFSRVNLMVARSLREDLEEIDVVGTDEQADAIVLGDLGPMFSAETLTHAFRQMMDGAELIALQHNRYWKREDGLVLDVGAFSAALEYAAETEAVVVGKPSPDFFRMALADVDASADRAVMVGDDIEGDIGGGLASGITSVLVRTGKYKPEKVAESGIEPTATIDSIADLPQLLS